MNADAMPAAPTSEAWPMYRSLVGVGLLCGILIVTAFLVTRERIESNKAAALERAIFQVLPGAQSSATFRLAEDDGFAKVAERAKGDVLVYAAYDGERRLLGLAVEAQGMGYQDAIRVLYGYSFAADAIVGIRVLESKETPGLGDKIENDPGFLENFERLEVALTDAGAIAHPIEPVKHGKKQHPWQIDAITGATVSSNAIARILAESTAFWVPRIRKNLDDFRLEE